MRLPAVRRVLLVLSLALVLLAPAVPALAQDADYDVTIRRTAHGIPHILAKDYGPVGMAMCVFTGHLALFALGCFMVGMSQAVYNLARQSYMTEAVPMKYRARALSANGSCVNAPVVRANST